MRNSDVQKSESPAMVRICRYAGTASTTVTAEAVGTMRVRRKPAVASRAAYSASVVPDRRGMSAHHIEHLARVRRVTGRQNHFDEEEPALRRDRFPAMAKD